MGFGETTAQRLVANAGLSVAAIICAARTMFSELRNSGALRRGVGRPDPGPKVRICSSSGRQYIDHPGKHLAGMHGVGGAIYDILGGRPHGAGTQFDIAFG